MIDGNNSFYDVTTAARLKGMASWPGIGNELRKIGVLSGAESVNELSLIKLTKMEKSFVHSKQEWKDLFANTPVLRKEAKKLFKIGSTLKNAPLNANNNDKINFFYALQDFKDKLLSGIIHDFNSSNDTIDKDTKKELKKNFRLAISYINHELAALIEQVPDLQSKYMQNQRFFSTSVGRLFANASFEKKVAIASHLPSSDPNLLFETMQASFEELKPEQLELYQLGGVNNANFIMVLKETAQELVLSIGPHPKYQVFIDSLYSTPCERYLNPVYYTSDVRLEGDIYRSITIQAKARYSLTTERVRELESATDNKVVGQACNRMIEMATFCEDIINANGCYVDIKLDNFLIHPETGALILADKKAFMPLTNKKTLDSRVQEIYTTEIYAPPEFAKEKSYNPESYNAYQMGLVLYDYIALPGLNPVNLLVNNLWCKKPLNFDNPYFDTMVGKKMQQLITAMLDDDPSQRPSLAEIKAELANIVD